jgi:hypothetical protein
MSLNARFSSESVLSNRYSSLLCKSISLYSIKQPQLQIAQIEEKSTIKIISPVIIEYIIDNTFMIVIQ